jgi:tetratricopeptide (TPR) repeat protein/transcriptional regulator with XRE-family HTH domain
MEVPAHRDNDFGDLLHQYRLRARLTQEELAERSGLSVRAIANMERGRTARPYRRSVASLADALTLTGPARDELTRAAGLPAAADLAHAVSEPVAADTGSPVPRQLPGPVAQFVGRTAELAELTRRLDQAAEGPSATMVISAIGGTAGVGKTALAVHWAYSAAARFPDGQLYMNLRGYDPDSPVSPADALAAFLRALGVPGREVPADAQECAARYRSLLAGRRMLVVLDNASEIEQVRLLLPGTPSCVTVVTSRDSLAGLVARDGAQRMDLDLLTLAESVRLLRALIGARVDDDPAAAAALAERCCRLPLPLRVAAEFATARPAVPLGKLADELASQQRRLDLLEVAGDARTAVRTVFSWSYRHLAPGTSRAFRLAGLHPGAELDGYAVAALTASSLPRAQRVLDQLARAHLIQLAGPARYVMHDLLRDYARERAAAEDGEDERRAALMRLYDHYLHTAAAAAGTLFPDQETHQPRLTPGTPAPPVDTPGPARAWLEAEHATLVAVTADSVTHDSPGHAVGLALALQRYLDVSALYPEAAAIFGHACRAAARTGDRAAEGQLLLFLGSMEWHQGRLSLATAHYEQAADLSRQIGDRSVQARALHSLGIGELGQGRYAQAIDLHQQAVSIYREIGDRGREGRALHNIAAVDFQQGRYQRAAGYLRRALDLAEGTGDRMGQAHTLGSLGAAEVRQGEYVQAAEHLRLALALNREISYRAGEAYTLSVLGELCLAEGRHQAAFDHLFEALAQVREAGDKIIETATLNILGGVFLAVGQPDQACTQYASALALASEMGDDYEQARAHCGLASGYRAASAAGHGSIHGSDAEVRHHWETALAIYAELAAPEADQIRAQLAAEDDAGER